MKGLSENQQERNVLKEMLRPSIMRSKKEGLKMEREKLNEKMITCDEFVENQANELLKELKMETETYGEIRRMLELLPKNNSFGFVVRRTMELLNEEISTIKVD